MENDNPIELKYITEKSVGIIGVTVKEGQNLEGPELAPKYMRESGLFDVIKSLDWEYTDYGDIDQTNIEIETTPDEETDKKRYKYYDVKNARVLGAANKKLYETANKICLSKQFCLTLGGDHGIATGSISGVKSAYPDLKIIWVDAHGDCNVPEDSPSGNYHGMPVAHLLGWIEEKTVPGFDWFKPCITADDIVYIGLRDLDPAEKINLKKHKIKHFTMHEVLKYGLGEVFRMTMKHLNKDGREHPLHISFDVDGIDPTFAYGTGTKSRGGLLYREAHYIVREAHATGCLVSADIVEINPLLDTPKEMFHGDSKLIHGTETVSLGIELVASCLGDSLS